MARLDIYAKMELLLSLTLESEDVLIGRSPQCAVQLPSDRVSRIHAIIRRKGDGWEVEDRSTNGTRHNHEMVEGTAPLEEGDRLYIGDYVIVYQGDDASDPGAEPDQTVFTKLPPMWDPPTSDE